MKDLVFVTGNMNKVRWVEKFLGRKINHHDLALDEVQDLDPLRVLEYKTLQAYQILRQPVLVEDASLVLTAMGRLPGPFIKFFLSELGNEGIIKLLNNYEDKAAVHSVHFGLYDGSEFLAFSAEGKGVIAGEPKGGMGFGFDAIFIPEGQTKTRGEMSEFEYAKIHPRNEAVQKLAGFLSASE